MSYSALFAHPFRIFFLAGSVYAILLISLWVAFISGAISWSLGLSPTKWHSHEMIFGFVGAIITGFILTAMTNWTGAQALSGRRLLLLFSIWLTARLCMLTTSWLAPHVSAGIDLVFYVALAVYVFQVLWRTKNYRNLILVAVLVCFTASNALMHFGFITNNPLWLAKGQQMGLDLVALLIVIIGGRIIPAFSTNWLRKNGRNGDAVKRYAVLDLLSIISLVALFFCALLDTTPTLAAGVCLIAATANTLRLLAWRPYLVLSEALLWVLHLAYFWLVIALFLRAFGVLLDGVDEHLWLHVFGVGAIGTSILGVMTRVAVGHTGRPLGLLRHGVFIYLFISASAITRVLTSLNAIDYKLGLMASACFWGSAFLLFVFLYGPILCSPRADGRPG